MVRRNYTPERIINNLREAEVLLSQESTVGEASRKIGQASRNNPRLIYSDRRKIVLRRSSS